MQPRTEVMFLNFGHKRPLELYKGRHLQGPLGRLALVIVEPPGPRGPSGPQSQAGQVSRQCPGPQNGRVWQ